MPQKKLSSAQINAIMALSPSERYKHTIKQIVGWGKLWSLYNDGWALIGDDENQQYLPIWPAKEYAEFCKSGYWEDYQPLEIDLDFFIDGFLSDLKADNINIAVFVTSNDTGITPTYEQLIHDISAELSNY